MRLKCWRQPAADTRALSFGKMSTALYLQTEVMILKSSSTNCCTLPGQMSLFDSTESGGGFAGYGEVAYRVVDAKYWGVPQRRKRVYAVADTGGESANEILFDRKGDEWNFRPRLPAGKAVAGLADDCYCWHERMVQSKSEPMPQCCGFIYKAGAKANGIGVGNETPTMKTDCPPAVAYSTNTQSDL